MCELLSELDRGPVAVAPGSQVTLFNMQDGASVMALVRPPRAPACPTSWDSTRGRKRAFLNPKMYGY